MWDVTMGSFWFQQRLFHCQLQCSSALHPVYNLNFNLTLLGRCFKTKQEKPKTPKQTNTPNLSSTTYILFCPMQKLRDGGGDGSKKNNTLKNSIIHPFKLFERALSLPKMFPKGGVFFCGLLQKLHVNNIPLQMPLLYGVEALSPNSAGSPLLNLPHQPPLWRVI